MNWKLSLSAIVLILAIGGLIWWATTNPRTPKEPETPEQIIREAQNEPIPENARSIDEFTFADERDVYLKSVYGTSTTKIPGADPATFRIVSPFAQFENQEITDFCKGPGTYSTYADKNKVYFFQFWKTPTFAKTRIEVVKGLNADAVTAGENHTITDGTATFAVGYSFATTTCELVLEPS